MLKQILNTILFLFLATPVLAQQGENFQRMGKRPPKSQFATYVMKGFNAAFEYSSMDADQQIITSTEPYKGNTNSPAGALGISINYASLSRNGSGWSVGLTLINKIENETLEKNSLKASESFMQVRPEANFGYAFSNGLWGMTGGHISWLTGDSRLTNELNAFGLGLQVSIGYTPKRNFGADIGYYLSQHNVNNDLVSRYNDAGTTVEANDSWLRLRQLRARATYYF